MKSRTQHSALWIGFVFAGVCVSAGANAEPALTGPPMDTQGKPLNPPAPSEGIAPKLAGLNVLGGAAFIDLGPLNDRLSSAGYPNKLPLAFPILGGQGFGLFNHFMIGGSGTGFLSRSVNEPNGREASASGAWGTFDFGYQALRVNGFVLAPIVSLGGYGMSVTVDSKQTTSFNAALSDPTRSTNLTNKGFLGGISVMANWIVLGRGSTVRGARSGMSVGLRVGALYGFPYRNWRADGGEATGGPSFGLRGGYAALSLGVGRW